MRTYEEQREVVINLQKRTASVNHKLENPRLSTADYFKLTDEKERLEVEHDLELRKMWSYDEYQGIFKGAVK